MLCSASVHSHRHDLARMALVLALDRMERNGDGDGVEGVFLLRVLFLLEGNGQWDHGNYKRGEHGEEGKNGSNVGLLGDGEGEEEEELHL